MASDLFAALLMRTPNTITRKAGAFAAILSLYWFFFAIGVWYAAKFTALGGHPVEHPTFLFGATFVVWFVAYFGAIAFFLIKERFATRYV